MESYQLLPRFNAWANSKIYRMCVELSDTDYRMDRKAFFGSIHNTLNHILLVDILWTARIRGYEEESIKSLDQILHESLDDLNAAQQKEDRKLIELVDGMDREELKRPMKYTRMNGQKGEDSVGDVLVTLYNHQTHHRGQVHTMLTQIGVDPPDMDVIDYLHSEKAGC